MGYTKEILDKIKMDMHDILSNYKFEHIDDDTKKEIEARLSNYFTTLGDDIIAKTIDFSLTLDKDKKSYIVNPGNFITALWFRGENPPSNIVDTNVWETPVCIYTWDEDKKELFFTTKAKANLL